MMPRGELLDMAFEDLPPARQEAPVELRLCAKCRRPLRANNAGELCVDARACDAAAGLIDRQRAEAEARQAADAARAAAPAPPEPVEPPRPDPAVPSEEEPEPMADEKKCPYCKKKLRTDNSRGACSECLAKGRPIPNGEGEVDELAGLKLAPAKSKTRSDTIKRFRIVAEAMGKDPDKMLEEYAEGWLELLKQKVEEDANA